ncbi:12215_t:CDS:2 [Cetraspora pellucida]|uniref:12215_t:CDS:1 n=1 Tax=Cetraspora pellucida TaxID=1433469 RepID=A0A9N9ISI4_9GLOM|nr:12215_t:CDS:2 [Cetraspora pellucida]
MTLFSFSVFAYQLVLSNKNISLPGDVNNPCIKCPHPPTECDLPCDRIKKRKSVCIITQQTCTKCPKKTCKPADDEQCWIDKPNCYNCGSSHCIKPPLKCITCPSETPEPSKCPKNYKRLKIPRSCFVCAQVVCLPEHYHLPDKPHSF